MSLNSLNRMPLFGVMALETSQKVRRMQARPSNPWLFRGGREGNDLGDEVIEMLRRWRNSAQTYDMIMLSSD